MAEQIYLDPVELLPERQQIEITPLIKADPGVDWGDGVAVPYKAQGDRGELVVDERWENRQIGIPLAIKSIGGTSFATYRSLLQGVMARWASEGGVLKRVTQQGTVYADIPIGGMRQGGNFLQALQRGDTEAELHLEAIPDFYEPEVEVASAEEKTLPELIKVIPDPGGDMPARVRIVVEEKQGADQKGLIWALRSRYYASATTAKPAYSATELQPLGIATKEAVSGATGGTAVSNSALTSQWGPVVGTNIGGTAYLTHQGTYRVYARLRSSQGPAVSARFVWDVGDLTYPTENAGWSFPGGSAWYVADLGEIRLKAPPVGTHRWLGQIQAKGSIGGEGITVDRVWFVNSDDRSGVLTAPPVSVPSLAVPVASDNFNATTAGTLTGKVAPLGGTWTGAGDAVGFTVDTTNHWVTRSEKSDADLNSGYYARLGAGTAATVEVAADILVRSGGEFMFQGVFARYSNTNNWLMVGWSGPGNKVVLKKRVGGTVTLLAESAELHVGGTRTLRLRVDAKGGVTVYDGPQGASANQILAASDTSLAAGGALESGGYGIYDAYTQTAGFERQYDNFVVLPPIGEDAVAYASQKAQLTTIGVIRSDTTGTAYGPVARVIGDLPRLPAGGNEGRSVELFVKASRGDFNQVADSAIDDLGVKVFTSRSWLTVPGV